MLRNLCFPVLGLCLLAPIAFAHDTLSTQWCKDPNVVPVITKHFSFTPEMMLAYRMQHLEDDTVLGSTCQTPKSCGIVDDWFWANQMAHEYCGGSLQKKGTLLTTESQTAMPFIIAPGDFNLSGDENNNGIADHHDEYRFKDGNLTGMCVACPPGRVSPAPLPAEPAALQR